MIAVAVVAQHDQVALTLEADTLVRPVMDFKLLATTAEVAGVARLLQRQGADALPMRRL